MSPVKVFLLLSAAFCTGWAAVSWAVGFDADFKFSALVAVLCLGGKELLDYREAEIEEQRYRWESGREDVWDRRDIERLREID